MWTIHRILIHKTRKDSKVKFYKAMAIPVALYGSETWVLSHRDRGKVISAEKKNYTLMTGKPVFFYKL